MVAEIKKGVKEVYEKQDAHKRDIMKLVESAEALNDAVSLT